MAKRFGRDCFGDSPRYRTKGHWKDILKWDADAGKRGVRERVFVNSMSDIGEANPQVDPWRMEALNLLAGLKNLDVLLLTKRPEHLRLILIAWNYGHPIPSHFWVGCTVENQEMAFERIPHLLQIRAKVRFISVEPMLGPVDLLFAARPGYPESFVEKLDWVIVGGESGPKARPIHPEWINTLRNQCSWAGTPLLFKQWGEFNEKGLRVGKKAAGRTWNNMILDGYPEVKA
jgi:protein gp37